MEDEHAEIRVGDFVEAVFVADPEVIRRGVVVEVLNVKTVLVKGRGFESTCDQPRKIPMKKLTPEDRDLIKEIFPSLKNGIGFK